MAKKVMKDRMKPIHKKVKGCGGTAVIKAAITKKASMAEKHIPQRIPIAVKYKILRITSNKLFAYQYLLL